MSVVADSERGITMGHKRPNPPPAGERPPTPPARSEPTTRWTDDRAEELKELQHLLDMITGLNNGNKFIESVQQCIKIAERLQMRRDLHPSFVGYLVADCIQERQVMARERKKNDELLEQKLMLDQKDATIRMLRASLVDYTRLLNCATDMITPDDKARSREEMTDDELMEIARPFVADGGRWASWLSVMRLAISASEDRRKQ